MQTAENNINDCTIAQLENNRAILRLPIKTLEDDESKSIKANIKPAKCDDLDDWDFIDLD